MIGGKRTSTRLALNSAALSGVPSRSTRLAAALISSHTGCPVRMNGHA